MIDQHEPGARPVEQIPDMPPRTRSRRLILMMLLLAFAAGLAAVLAVGFGRDPSVVNSVLLDRPAPSLRGQTLDGSAFDLSAYDGQITVVNFWASWCTACRKEHPELVAAARRLSPLGVQFVGVDTQDTVPAARAFLKEMGDWSYPSVFDPDGRHAVNWGTFGVPETFLVDETGRVRAKVIGPVTEEWLVSNINVLLAEQPR